MGNLCTTQIDNHPNSGDKTPSPVGKLDKKQLCSDMKEQIIQNQPENNPLNINSTNTLESQLKAQNDMEQSRLTLFERNTINETVMERSNKLGLQDFQQIRMLGQGSFGKVYLVKFKQDNKYYAMKVLKKQDITNERQRIRTRTERHILETIDHPFIVRLHFAFQTQKKLYLVVDYMNGGELFYHLKLAENGRFTEQQVRFYSAQVLLAIEHLHQKNIIYRDLKPENILLDQDGYIKIADFGLSKLTLSSEQHAHSLCGTPEYLAPEILLSNNGHDKTVDWWSFGALLYEMFVGAPPHYSSNKQKMFKKICQVPIPYPNFISPNAKSLLQSLLIVNPTKRLGYGQSDSKLIKKHPFFQGIKWNDLRSKQLETPLHIKLKGPDDLKYFDSKLALQLSNETPTKCIELTKSIENFSNFTYIRNLQQRTSFDDSSVENIENQNYKVDQRRNSIDNIFIQINETSQADTASTISPYNKKKEPVKQQQKQIQQQHQ